MHLWVGGAHSEVVNQPSRSWIPPPSNCPLLASELGVGPQPGGDRTSDATGTTTEGGSVTGP